MQRFAQKVKQQCIFGQSLLKTSAVSFPFLYPFLSSLRKITGYKHVNPQAMAFCWKESLSANEIVCLFGKLHFNLPLWDQCFSPPFTVHKLTIGKKIRFSWHLPNKRVSCRGVWKKRITVYRFLQQMKCCTYIRGFLCCVPLLWY